VGTGLLETLVSQSPLAAGALILAYLFVRGKVHSDAEFRRVAAERDEYKRALDAERKAVNETAQAAAVTNNLISAVVTLAADRQGVALAPRPVSVPEELQL